MKQSTKHNGTCGACDETKVETCKPRSDVPTMIFLSQQSRKNIFEPKICDQIVDEPLISLFFKR